LGWSAAEPVSEALRSRVDEALPLLGPGLRAGTTRAHARREASDDAGEVAELFSLTRALASSIEVADALEAARGCLDALLRPDAGGVRLAVENDGRFVWHVWPEDEPREPMAARLESAAARAASSGLVMPLTDSSGRTWLCSGSGETASIAVAFRGPPPVDKGSRVLPAVCASLSLACDRFRAQRSREDSRLEAALDGIPVGIVLTDAVGRIRLANPVGERLLRAFTAWPGTGEPLTRLGAVDVTSWFSQGDEPHEMEIREPEGGRTVVVRLFPASPLADAEAKGDRVLVLEDVTESRRHKRQMLQAEKLSSLGILISGIVHEINNPLATILGYAQMLRREPRSQAETRWIERLFEEAKRCQTIVRDMLDTARPKESGRRAVAVPPVVEKALGLMAHPLRAAGIETVVHARPDVAPVHVEPDALLRVVLNLLTNALHALEEHSGQRRIEIAVRPAPETGRVEISVGDSGPGIRPEHQDKIFDPFFTTKAEGKGSGLGLSLVEATVREHGGSLEVDSAPGRGARFTFSLPAAATPEGSAEGRPPARGAPRGPRGAARARRRGRGQRRGDARRDPGSRRRCDDGRRRRPERLARAHRRLVRRADLRPRDAAGRRRQAPRDAARGAARAGRAGRLRDGGRAGQRTGREDAAPRPALPRQALRHRGGP
jgi:signal transduction histidine kinase